MIRLQHSVIIWVIIGWKEPGNTNTSGVDTLNSSGYSHDTQLKSTLDTSFTHVREELVELSLFPVPSSSRRLSSRVGGLAWAMHRVVVTNTIRKYTSLYFKLMHMYLGSWRHLLVKIFGRRCSLKNFMDETYIYIELIYQISAQSDTWNITGSWGQVLAPFT